MAQPDAELRAVNPASPPEEGRVRARRASPVSRARARARRVKRELKLGRSPLTGLAARIISLNAIALIVLLVGAMWLSQYREGLIRAKTYALEDQARLLAELLAETALPSEGANPQLDPTIAVEVLRRVLDDVKTQVWLYDNEGVLITGTHFLNQSVYESELPPIETDPSEERRLRDALKSVNQLTQFVRPNFRWRERARSRSIDEELLAALSGAPARAVRMNADEEVVVSVTVPIQRVQAVQAVLSLEDGDIEPVLEEAQDAILSIFWLALVVSIGASLALTATIARPIEKLAAAADRVRAGLDASMRNQIPNFSQRPDEIGRLSASLIAMTNALYERLDAIEQFAADVAHELKNPLTSIRSAVETLDIVKDDKGRDKLVGVIQQDVSRMNRLITDISNASRLDAELARQHHAAFDISNLMSDIVAAYAAMAPDAPPRVELASPPLAAQVTGSPDSLAQVFRNLIDNALSFSPNGASVRVRLTAISNSQSAARVRICVEDDGPGVPPENLKTIFERFLYGAPGRRAVRPELRAWLVHLKTNSRRPSRPHLGGKPTHRSRRSGQRALGRPAGGRTAACRRDGMSAPSRLHLNTVALALGEAEPRAGIALIGRSGAGKSDLTLRLIETCPFARTRLIADDYTDIRAERGALYAAPPPAIAGMIEVRGAGVVQADYCENIALVAAFELNPPAARMPDARHWRPHGLADAPELPLFSLAPFEASAAAKARCLTRAILAGHFVGDRQHIPDV